MSLAPSGAGPWQTGKWCGAPRCMRSRGPAFAHPVGLRPGCPDREVDLLCSRASVGPRRVRQLPALRADAGLPQPARRSHRRPPPRPPGPSAPRSPAAPPPGCPDGPTFVVGVHRTSCPAPSPPRSPAASPSEVALRGPGGCARCCRGGSEPVHRRRGCPLRRRRVAPRTCFAFLDVPPSLRLPAGSLVSQLAAVRGCPRWLALLVRRTALLCFGPLGGPVSRSSAVRSLPRRAVRAAVQWESSTPVSPTGTRGFGEVSELVLVPTGCAQAGGSRAPDVPMLSPDSCTAWARGIR